MVSTTVSVLLLVVVAVLVGADEENDAYEASIDIYEQAVQDLEHQQAEPMKLDNLIYISRKELWIKKCKTLGKCKKAKGKCTAKKHCAGKIDNKATKKGCSKGCVCCTTKTKPTKPKPPPKPKTTPQPATDQPWFNCDNGRKIPGVWMCDGVDDCGDGSDETANCVTCAGGETKCPNGLCIRESWKCDGFDDCGDNSDEANCDILTWTLPTTGTTGGQNTTDPIVIHNTCSGFECTNKKCIISSWKCDGWDDCGDNSDEEGCNECASTEFTCEGDGKCIRGDWKCDGINDCSDNSDEKDCKVKCNSDQFQCVTSGKCIIASWKCDNYKDCTDGSDEKDCKKCDGDKQFECRNKNCISAQKKCNGKDDCGDGSDEENCPTTCQCGMPNTMRVIGGTEVNPKRKYPWQIGLQQKGYYISCGGTIINDRWILTAAHCITDRNTCRLKHDASSTTLKVLVGEHKQYDTSDDVSDTKQYKIKTFIPHPNYNCRSVDYDFALLELTEPIPFNNVIRPICLPKDDSKTYAGETGLLTGWGKISNARQMSMFLREVEVPILANDKCGDWGYKPAVKICGGGEEGKGSCGGDSGGPLHVKEGSKYVQVGVVSYGHNSGCATSAYPTVYARVSKVLDWITTNTANGKKCN